MPVENSGGRSFRVGVYGMPTVTEAATRGSVMAPDATAKVPTYTPSATAETVLPLRCDSPLTLALAGVSSPCNPGRRPS